MLVHLSPELGTLSAKRVFFWDKGRDRGVAATIAAWPRQSCGNEALRVEEICFSATDAVDFHSVTQQAS